MRGKQSKTRYGLNHQNDERQSQSIKIPNIILIVNLQKILMQTNNSAAYIGHTLNNSPSKTSYTFSRSTRFPTQPQEYGRDQSGNMADGYRTAKKRYEQDQEPGWFGRPVSKNRGRNQEADRNRSGSKQRKNSPSPPRWRLSPKRSNNQQYADQNQEKPRSPFKHKQIVKSYRNGYYPYGIQINKEGKFYVSNYQNVKTASFGRPSGRDISYANDKPGPGYYDVANKSPGKYKTSDNKNNDAQRFSRSPRRVSEPAYESIGKSNFSTLGPGQYSVFSEFGPAYTK